MLQRPPSAPFVYNAPCIVYVGVFAGGQGAAAERPDEACAADNRRLLTQFHTSDHVNSGVSIAIWLINRGSVVTRTVTGTLGCVKRTNLVVMVTRKTKQH